jgi:hypothetical protein
VERSDGEQCGPLFIYVYGSSFSVIGRVVTFGLNHFSYEFMGSGESHPREVNADIFTPGYGFHVQRLPCLLIAHSCCRTGKPVGSAPLSICDLYVSVERGDESRAFADLVGRAPLCGQAQGDLEPESIQARQTGGCRAGSRRSTFVEWLAQYDSFSTGEVYRPYGHGRGGADMIFGGGICKR